MSAAVTEADRQAAHTVPISGGCFPALWNGAHSVVCDDITRAFATAREAGERAGAERENRACEEIARLKNLLHRDRTGLALGLNKIQRIAKGFDWICEGRGPYAHDDHRYRMEVGSLITQVLAVADEQLRASGELANKSFHPRAKETARMLAEDCAARRRP